MHARPRRGTRCSRRFHLRPRRGAGARRSPSSIAWERPSAALSRLTKAAFARSVAGQRLQDGAAVNIDFVTPIPRSGSYHSTAPSVGGTWSAPACSAHRCGSFKSRWFARRCVAMPGLWWTRPARAWAELGSRARCLRRAFAFRAGARPWRRPALARQSDGRVRRGRSTDTGPRFTRARGPPSPSPRSA